jgi:hypothetical protein
VFDGSSVPESGVSLHVKDSIFEIAGFRETNPRLRHPHDEATPPYTPLPTSLIFTIDILSADCAELNSFIPVFCDPVFSVQRHAFVLEYIHPRGNASSFEVGSSPWRKQEAVVVDPERGKTTSESEHKPVCHRHEVGKKRKTGQDKT